jgi:hypothetical protein
VATVKDAATPSHLVILEGWVVMAGVGFTVKVAALLFAEQEEDVTTALY